MEALGFGCQQIGGLAFGNLNNRDEIVFFPATGWLNDSGGGFSNSSEGFYWTIDSAQSGSGGWGINIEFGVHPPFIYHPNFSDYPNQFGFAVRCVRND